MKKEFEVWQDLAIPPESSIFDLSFLPTPEIHRRPEEEYRNILDERLRDFLVQTHESFSTIPPKVLYKTLKAESELARVASMLSKKSIKRTFNAVNNLSLINPPRERTFDRQVLLGVSVLVHFYERYKEINPDKKPRWNDILLEARMAVSPHDGLAMILNVPAQMRKNAKALLV